MGGGVCSHSCSALRPPMSCGQPTFPLLLGAGALSLMYLPLPITNAVRVMLVAHNADYNGTWHIGTAVSAPA